jgi:hypothetical protein
MVPSWAKKILNLYVHYKNNILPYSGGILEQPAPFVQAMQIIEAQVCK